MKTVTGYLGKTVIHANATDTKHLSKLGIRCRYLPDPPDIFDEYEFGIDYKGNQDMAFLVTVEKGKIARILFGATDPDNPDILKPVPDDELALFEKAKKNVLAEFFDLLTN